MTDRALVVPHPRLLLPAVGSMSAGDRAIAVDAAWSAYLDALHAFQAGATAKTAHAMVLGYGRFLALFAEEGGRHG